MSKAHDDARVPGSLQADRDASGELDTVVGNSSDAPDDVGSGPAATDSMIRSSSSSSSSRWATEAPTDAVPEPRAERESQARARNREALRALRALAEAQATQDDGRTRIETPTRRQMRLQQSQGRAVAPAAVGGAATVQGTAPVAPRSPMPGGRRDRRRRQASGTPAIGVVGDSATGATPFVGTPDAGPLVDGTAIEGATSQDAIEGATSQDHGALDPAGTPGGTREGDMSVAEALTARKAIAEKAGEHLAALRATGPDDPFTVDPVVLAQQKALAERAAVLNARARQMQELAGQNQQSGPASIDPSAAHNLSIIAPPEFVRLPGGSQSVLRAPATSHIPVVLARPKESTAAPHPGSGVSVGRERGGTAPEGPATAGADSGAQPIRARSAFGLEPLDAMTAGLGRLRRVRYIQYSLLGVGAAALITGIIMTVSSLNG